MAPLVRIAPDLRAVLAPHVALQLMDWRCLRSPHDAESNGLVSVAAKAFHFEIAIPGVERVTQRRRWLRRSLTTPRRRAGRLPCGLPSRALPPPGSMRRRWSRVIWCPWRGGCAGPRWAGKPLQIAVDSAPPTGSGRTSSRVRNRAAQPLTGRSRCSNWTIAASLDMDQGHRPTTVDNDGACV